MNNTFELKKIGTFSILLLIGFLLGWIIFSGTPPEPPSTITEHIEGAHTDEEGNIIYSCSMHPNVRENEPGNCPICGMELIPVSNNNVQAGNANELVLTNAALKLADIQTTKVISEVAVQTRRLPGKVEIDERRMSTLPSHVPGRIEELFVNFTGEYIKKGQKVASIYSPVLQSAQKELIEVSKFKEQNPSLYKAAKNKLRNWEISETQIAEIERSETVMNEIDIHSKVEGFVIERMINVGEHVSLGSAMFRVADLSKVWVVFEAFESDIANIEVGDQITFSVDALSQNKITAPITYIDPVLNNQTRTIGLRAEVDNKNGLLKSGMLVDGLISSPVKNKEPQLLIPKSAILWTGDYSVVYVKNQTLEAPTFEFRQVELGQRIGDLYIVESGLEEGEEVVTNGTFKIDSASQLAGKASMMNQNPDGRKVSTGHEGHQIKPISTVKEEVEDEQLSSKSMALFKNQLGIVVDEYINLKNHLVASSSEDVQKSAGNLIQNLKEVDMSLLNHNDHMIWMDQLAALNESVSNIERTSNLADQRTHFQSLSSALIESVKQFQIEGVFFQQFCPMTNGGKGAFWLSEKEQINNPYYGNMMLNCGETISRIEF